MKLLRSSLSQLPPEWTSTDGFVVSAQLYRKLRDEVLPNYTPTSFLPYGVAATEPTERLVRMLGPRAAEVLNKPNPEFFKRLHDKHSNDAAYILNAYVWICISQPALASASDSGRLSMFTQYCHFINSHPGNYKDYADVQTALDPKCTSTASVKLRTQFNSHFVRSFCS
jgi:hypothetical protein